MPKPRSSDLRRRESKLERVYVARLRLRMTIAVSHWRCKYLIEIVPATFTSASLPCTKDGIRAVYGTR
jgi:hypothetical protein